MPGADHVSGGSRGRRRGLESLEMSVVGPDRKLYKLARTDMLITS